MSIPRARVTWFLVGAVSLWLAWPERIVLAPPWKIEVVNRRGEPLSGVAITEYWRHYGYQLQDAHEEATTDDTGSVTFPPRVMWTCALGKAIFRSANFVQTGFHSRSQILTWSHFSVDGMPAVFPGKPPYDASRQLVTRVEAPALEKSVSDPARQRMRDP
jgi:hypothetical protein